MAEQWLDDSLPTPFELKDKTPLSLDERKFVLKRRDEVRSILDGSDSRKMVIVGPCSLHDPEAAVEYAQKLSALSTKVESSLLIIMRAYFEKPRTRLGWRGYLHDPHMNGSCDIASGLFLTRDLLQKLAALNIPLATEFLDPAAFVYFEDLITWGCIGARTSSSQIHRQIAASANLPIAFKNSVEGNIETALNAIEVANQPQTYMGINGHGVLKVIRSQGNPYAHLVLRGGERGPNFQESATTIRKMKERGLNPSLIIDCSHGNSEKNHLQQKTVFEEALSLEGVKGFMLESFLFEGAQPLKKPLAYGISVTDSCLNWEMTEELIYKCASCLVY
jgi:3-deoxy-7-phosphoheptulonate synthase